MYRYDLIGKRVRTDKGWGTVKDVDFDGELFIDLDDGREIARMPDDLLSVPSASHNHILAWPVYVSTNIVDYLN